MPVFLLCDPALIMPPPEGEEDALRFWMRVVEWAADHRVRLGPAGHDMVVSLLGSVGWPQFDSARYPPGMARLAYRALSMMLSQVMLSDCEAPAAPSLSPVYQAHERGAQAIGSDAVALHAQDVMGIATDPGHWAAKTEVVHFDPPPPDSLPLLFEPNGPLAEERDRAVARHLEDKRLTIIGGIESDQTISELEARFFPNEIRWFGAEPGSRLNLDGLEGLKARSDVVYCVAGHIGHDGSIKARQCCRKRGVEMRKVQTANDIADDLCRRHG